MLGNILSKLPPFTKAEDRGIDFKKKKGESFDIRRSLLPYFLIFLFLILFIRLFDLTVVKGSYYRYLSEENRIKEEDIEAPRGSILDRKGFTIVYSEERNDGSQRRVYNEGESFAHLVGFIQVASSADLSDDPCKNRLKLNEKTGKEGIEKVYECILRGRRGKKLTEVEASGYEKKLITVIPPDAGKDLRLSVDLELQKLAYGKLKDKKGAIIASKPATGEILILTSSPSFNPQAFADENELATSNFLKDAEKPLFDRATNGVYPPGSIFKLVVAAAALEGKVIDEKTEFEDTGEITAGPLKFANWYFKKYGKTDGMVNLVKGIKRSNDIFFYKLGAKVGPENIKIWAEKFGYGAPTGILLGDEEGLIPSNFWKEENLYEGWFLGDTYNLSIGQGYLLTSPIQVNMATTVIASDGKLCKPKLVRDENPECKNLNISKKTLDLVREGMRQACSAGGTGWPFFEFKIKNEKLKIEGAKTTGVESGWEKLTPGVEEEQRDGKTPGVENIKVGCKTGTAEAQKKDALPHAWFTVFAPWENPEIVLTVMVENSGEGSEIAAPIAKDILKSYFERNE